MKRTRAIAVVMCLAAATPAAAETGREWLDRMTVAEAKRHFADNQFDKGSMGPKIQAVIEFLEGGGWMGLITNPPNIGRALAGETGTFIVREGVPAFTFHN